MDSMCDKVQWVFSSACEHIFEQSATTIVSQVMQLTEPEDICKQLSLCAPDFYDSQMAGGAPGMAPGVFPAGGMGMPSKSTGMLGNTGGAAISVNHPGMGFSGHSSGAGFGLYPPPGSRPMSSGSPYSPYTYGGYDAYGFPNPHPGVPSSTPPPPLAPMEGGEEGG
eukprot:g5344.t1